MSSPTRSRRRLLAPALATALLAVLPTAADAAYRDTVAATPDLASHWRLGEPSGSTSAFDETLLQNGTYAGTPVLGAAGALTADANTALTIDSAGDTFSAPDRAEYDVNGFTVEFWVKLNAYGDTTQYRAIAEKGYSAAQRNWLIALGSNANGQLTYGFGDGTTNIGRRSVGSLSVGTWTHVAFTHVPGTKIQLYLNGVLDSELATTATPVTSTAPIELGDNGEGIAVASASYDELAVYRRALSASEISAHYAAGATPAAACSKVASPSGNDTSGTGTVGSPYRTAQRVANTLTTGQTGCLRAGTYGAVDMVTAGTTLQAYPGDARPTLTGKVRALANDVTIQYLALDYDPVANGVQTSIPLTNLRTTLRGNTITNRNSNICIDAQIGADQFLIERNRIYNCGRINPRTNHDHGMYIQADDGVARFNVVYDNADRGLQFWEDGDRNRVYRNTFDGNGMGVNYGGVSTTMRSDDDIVEDNVITNSTAEWNAQVNYGTLTPVGNVFRNNCLFGSNATAYYNTNNSIDPDLPSKVAVSGTIYGNPLYVNRAAKDFRLSSGSPCAGKGAPLDVLQP
jgi:hypothetical protein